MRLHGWVAAALAAWVASVQPVDAKDWLVERVSGTVMMVGKDKTPKPVQAKMLIPEGITLVTQANGRVRLSSDNSVMTLSPNSTVAVVPSSFFSRTVNVQQRTGSVEFEVEKRSRPYFNVSSPYMAAVVKGTKFTISVARKNTNIAVTRGLVQVTDMRSGQSAAVGAGQRAEVASARAGLQTAGPKAPQVFQTKPQVPTVAPVGQDLTSFQAAAQAVSSASSTAPSAATSSSDSEQSSTTSRTSMSNSMNAGNSSSRSSTSNSSTNIIGRNDSGYGLGNNPSSGNSYGPGKGNGPGNGLGNGPGKGNGHGLGKGNNDDKGNGGDKGNGSGKDKGGGKSPGKGLGVGLGNGIGIGIGLSNGPSVSVGLGNGVGFGVGIGNNGNGNSGGNGKGNGNGH